MYDAALPRCYSLGRRSPDMSLVKRITLISNGETQEIFKDKKKKRKSTKRASPRWLPTAKTCPAPSTVCAAAFKASTAKAASACSNRSRR